MRKAFIQSATIFIYPYYETIPNPSRPGPPNIHGPNFGGAHVRPYYNRNLYNNNTMKRIDHATTTAEIIKTLDHVHTDADGYSYLLNHLLELKSCYWLISQMDQRKDELLKHSQNSADPKLKEYFLGQHDALNSFLGHFETLVKTQPWKFTLSYGASPPGPAPGFAQALLAMKPAPRRPGRRPD